MEDNMRNECIENGSINSFLRSGTSRTVTQTRTSSVTVASKLSVRQGNVKGNKTLLSQSHYTPSKHAVQSGMSQENGLSTISNEITYERNNVGGQNMNHWPSNEECNQFYGSRHSQSNRVRKSAYLFYKAAGDWWNVFPKTDYTYAKSSSSQKEIAPGVVTMPNMSRSPLHPMNDQKSTRSSLTLSRTFESEEYSDDVTSTTTKNIFIRNFLVSRVFIAICNIFSSTLSFLTLKKYWLGLEATPVSRRTGLKERMSLYRRFEVLVYLSACNFLLLDAWILSLFHSSRQKDMHPLDKKKHSKYLFLLLIPPLLCFGFGYNLTNTSATALISSVIEMKNYFSSVVVQGFFVSLLGQHKQHSMEGSNLDILAQDISIPEFEKIILEENIKNNHHMENEKEFSQSLKLEQEISKVEHGHKKLVISEQREILQELVKQQLTIKNPDTENEIENLKTQIKSLQAHHFYLAKKIEDYHRKIVRIVPKIEIEHHVTNFLLELFDDQDKVEKKPESMRLWIKTLVSAKDNLEKRLGDIVSIMNGRIQEATEKSAETIMESVSVMMKQEFMKKLNYPDERVFEPTKLGFSGKSTDCNECLSFDEIKEVVNKAILLYDADKTGMVDYALESGGGTVISIRCTENFNERSLVLAFLGMKFPWSSNHPRIALQPEVHPGKCWAFRGAQGYLVIRLAKTIKVSAFSIEHIPASISHTGNVDAAPKHFAVLGLDDEYDKNPILLGRYTYLSTGPPLQIFPVQNEDAPPYQIVELVVESNHGNVEYTCLYRFRVHGVAV